MYDTYGNPVHINVKGENIVYIWGYGGQYPVAEIRNYGYENVKSLLGSAPESFSTQNVPSTAVTSLQNKISDYGIVRQFLYEPLVGMVEMVDPNGNKTHYGYDSFGRLTTTKDNDSKILEEYNYNYQH